ncbi:MAG: hypothetical protein ACREMX_02330 [Gemmatimonadales bacterium]
MRSQIVLLTATLVTACAGAPLTTSFTEASPSPTPDVFGCVRQQLKEVAFDQTSIDVNDYRLTARKYNEKVRRPDVMFRRLVDRLEVVVKPGVGDTVTALSIHARTFAESVTQRGPTEEQEKTSETARAAAQTILQKCSQPVDSLSVPG